MTEVETRRRLDAPRRARLVRPRPGQIGQTVVPNLIVGQTVGWLVRSPSFVVPIVEQLVLVLVGYEVGSTWIEVLDKMVRLVLVVVAVVRLWMVAGLGLVVPGVDLEVGALVVWVGLGVEQVVVAGLEPVLVDRSHNHRRAVGHRLRLDHLVGLGSLVDHLHCLLGLVGHHYRMLVADLEDFSGLVVGYHCLLVLHLDHHRRARERLYRTRSSSPRKRTMPHSQHWPDSHR